MFANKYILPAHLPYSRLFVLTDTLTHMNDLRTNKCTGLHSLLCLMLSSSHTLTSPSPHPPSSGIDRRLTVHSQISFMTAIASAWCSTSTSTEPAIGHTEASTIFPTKSIFFNYSEHIDQLKYIHNNIISHITIIAHIYIT